MAHATAESTAITLLAWSIFDLDRCCSHANPFANHGLTCLTGSSRAVPPARARGVHYRLVDGWVITMANSAENTFFSWRGCAIGFDQRFVKILCSYSVGIVSSLDFHDNRNWHFGGKLTWLNTLASIDNSFQTYIHTYKAFHIIITQIYELLASPTQVDVIAALQSQKCKSTCR